MGKLKNKKKQEQTDQKPGLQFFGFDYFRVLYVALGGLFLVCGFFYIVIEE